MPLKLKAGCYYRTKAGRIGGPAEPRDSRVYPWEIGGELYTATGGFWSDGTPSPEDLIAEAPAPTEPKARKRKVRKMVTRWAMIVRSGIGTMNGWLGDSRKEARSKRAYLIREGLSCGPITRITLPAPAGRGKK